MVFYFSGTGNSLSAAKTIASVQGDQLISIADELGKTGNTFEYECPNGLLVFVYPIYAWHPAKLILDFIDRIQIKGEHPYVCTVATCGMEEGNATQIIKKVLARKGLPLQSAFSLRMPGNYTIGRHAPTDETVRTILSGAEEKLKRINDVITKRQKGVSDLLKGQNGPLKTGLIGSLFNIFELNAKNYYATGDCIHCKLCEQVCPIHTIKMVNGRPVWGKECTKCLACLNRCPAKAIQWGKSTLNNDRYVHPCLRKSSVK